MKITVNGSQMELRQGALLPELLERCGMQINSTAVWINGIQPLFSDYAETEIHDGDNVRLYFMCIGG